MVRLWCGRRVYGRFLSGMESWLGVGVLVAFFAALGLSTASLIGKLSPAWSWGSLLAVPSFVCMLALMDLQMLPVAARQLEVLYLMFVNIAQAVIMVDLLRDQRVAGALLFGFLVSE